MKKKGEREGKRKGKREVKKGEIRGILREKAYPIRDKPFASSGTNGSAP